MDTRGITIENLSVSWFQVLTAVFIIGGFAYSSISAFSTTQEMEKKYIPIINKLVMDDAEQTKAYEKLDATLTKLNTSIIAMTAVKEIEAKDVQNLKDDVKDLSSRVLVLETK